MTLSHNIVFMTADISSSELKDFLEVVKAAYGYDFTDYSEASMKRRIIHFMILKKLKELNGLKKLLLDSDILFEEFIQEISVTVTEMFRDENFYRSLREKVLPRLATYPLIKIWLAGCATGEELYSIAILLHEEGLGSRSIIYATDINQRSLMIAKEGIYGIDKMKVSTSSYLKSGGKNSLSQFYTAKYDSVIFDKSLKQNVVFSVHNLAVDKSFNEFQLIICRNVLIYFNQALQNKVVDLFYESLCPFGFLGLGNKESLLFCDQKINFEDVDRKEKIFIKAR